MSTSLFFLAMVLVGYIAQFVDGALGMGYGVFSASLLIAIGLYPAVASASVHTAEIFTTLISGASHLKFGNVRRDLVLPLAVPGVIGGVAGAYLLASIPGQTIKPFVAAILVVMGLIILFRFVLGKTPSVFAKGGLSTPKLLAIGFMAAFMDAIGGGGWGPIATSTLVLTGTDEPRKVVGSVNLSEFIVTVAMVLTFIATIGPESFRWDIVAALLIGGAVAAPMAAYLCRNLSPKTLGILIGMLLIGSNARTLLQTLL